MNRMISMYKKIPLPAKASIWFVFANIIQKGISMITIPIFTRLLSTEQYGIYSVYQSWYSILMIIFTLQLYAGVYTNWITHDYNKREEYACAFNGLNNVITGVFLLIYVCGFKFWNKFLGLSPFFVVLIFLEAFFEPAYNYWMVDQRFRYQYKKLVLVTLFIAIASPVTGIIMVLCTEHKAEARVLSFAMVQCFVGAIFWIHLLSKKKRFFNFEYWKKALSYNLPLIPHWLSLNVLGSSDRIMIGQMVGTGEAAIYGVAYNIASMFSLVTTAIMNTLNPYAYQKLKERNYRSLRKTYTLLFALVFCGCIMLTSIGPEIIKVFASKPYYEARWIIPSVAASFLFTFQYSIFAQVEFYYGKTKRIMIGSCSAAVLNLILNFLLIPKFGYIAASYTTLICYIALSVFHGLMSRNILISNDIHPAEVYEFKIIFLISIGLVIYMIAIQMVYDNLLIRYGVLVVSVIAILCNNKAIVKKLKEINGNMYEE